MIARIWHGKTPVSKAEAYTEFLVHRAIPDYEAVEGNRAAYVLRRMEADAAHFLTLTFWDSETTLETFAGTPIESAIYYPEDADYLLNREPTAMHYEVYPGVSAASGSRKPSREHVQNETK